MWPRRLRRRCTPRSHRRRRQTEQKSCWSARRSRREWRPCCAPRSGASIPRSPCLGEEPLAATLTESLGQRRFVMGLLTAFAVAALFLAALGIYGVLSYDVAQRRREIGIRMALGALPSAVGRLVVRRGLILAGFGLLVGGLASVGLTRVLRGLLFEVVPGDVATCWRCPCCSARSRDWRATCPRAECSRRTRSQHSGTNREGRTARGVCRLAARLHSIPGRRRSRRGHRFAGRLCHGPEFTRSKVLARHHLVVHRLPERVRRASPKPGPAHPFVREHRPVRLRRA